MVKFGRYQDGPFAVTAVFGEAGISRPASIMGWMRRGPRGTRSERGDPLASVLTSRLVDMITHGSEGFAVAGLSEGPGVCAGCAVRIGWDHGLRRGRFAIVCTHAIHD